MTEYLFRGKTDKGEWVYGSFAKTLYDTREIQFYNVIIDDESGCFDEVDPKTVGQLRHQNDQYGKYFDGDVYYHAGYGYETVSALCELQNALINGEADDICAVSGNIYEPETMGSNNDMG